jgi:isochorismate synthase
LGERLESRLSAALEASLLASPRLVVVTIPATLAEPEALFACHVEDYAHYFATGEAQGDVGLGTAESLEADTLTAVATLEQRAEALLRNCFEIGVDAAARPPRFCGAFAFDRAPSKAGPWHAFPRVGFRLPRFRYVTDSRYASLSLAVLAEEIATPDQRKDWVSRLLDRCNDLATFVSPEVPPTRVVGRHESPSRERWLQLVEQATNAMASDSLEKVVLAREIALDLDSPPNPTNILRRLARLAPETTRFAFRRGTSVFLGATPERLVLRLGSEIRTEALAGSIRATDNEAVEQLLASDKDRHEHQLVVEEIARKLARLGAVPQHAERPQVRQLRHVIHLSTPISARIFGPPHVLQLAAELHPTPAVCGVPEEAAQKFISETEGFERGLYSGAVGWFDADGDGEMLVALRAGLLDGQVFRLYAGAGIVRDSIPDKELDETELKCESLLEALDLAPTTSNGLR